MLATDRPRKTAVKMMQRLWAALLPIGPIRVTANYIYERRHGRRYSFAWAGWPEEQRRPWWEGVRGCGPVLLMTQRGTWFLDWRDRHTPFGSARWILYCYHTGGPYYGVAGYTFRLGAWRFVLIWQMHRLIRARRPIPPETVARRVQEDALLARMFREHQYPPETFTLERGPAC